MKLLFLDIDGVLNNHSSRSHANNIHHGDSLTYKGWDFKCVVQLKRIIAETGCQLVISSDWRHHLEDLQAGFTYFQLPNWIGITPTLPRDGHWHSHGTRGTEIASFLTTFTLKQKEDAGNEVTAYAIVDDNDWMLPSQSPVFVQTGDDFGLTKDLADKLIGILNHA